MTETVAASSSEAERVAILAKKAYVWWENVCSLVGIDTWDVQTVLIVLISSLASSLISRRILNLEIRYPELKR